MRERRPGVGSPAAVATARDWLGRHGVSEDQQRGETSPDADADSEAVARTIALRKLTGQARTRQELDRALAAKQVPAAVAEQVLDRLEDVGLVDDRRFAQDWVESRQTRRGLSRAALRRELQAKGVVGEVIEEALQPVAYEDELAAARGLALKKLRAMTGLDRQVRYRRLAGALSRRGFSSGVVASVLAEVLHQE